MSVDLPRRYTALTKIAATVIRDTAHATKGSRDDFVVSSVAWLVFCVLLVTLWALQPDTLTFTELGAFTALSVVFALLAVGQTVVLLSGGIDLSIGGSLSVTNVLAAVVITSKSAIPLGIAGVLASGAAMGLLNGVIIVYGKISPLIATLAMWFIWAGVALLVLPIPGGSVPPSMTSVIDGSLLAIPNAYWLMGLIAIAGSWFLRTRLGLSIRAIGSDPTGAAQSGIAVKRSLLCAYTICGFVTGVGGLLIAAQDLAGDPTTGANYLLPVVAAAVVGGTSLFGGRGGALGGIVGGLILTYVSAITAAATLPEQWGAILDGVILIGAVASQHFLRRLMSRPKRTGDVG